jgi:L,D-peptidoglycan transpeptidase YkuD (ErfK/YbiS/YcfS/YnhG family)
MKKLFGTKPLRRIGVIVVALLATGLAMKAFAGTNDAGPGTAVFAPDIGDAQQVVLVRTANWSDTVASVEAFDLVEGQWQRTIGPVSAVIGRNGFSGAHREGDGTSPVGVFTFRRTYGLQPAPSGLKVPDYQKFGAEDWWVSDPESPLYNQHVTGPPNGRWRPEFGERLADDQYRTAYRHLIAVEYNTEPAPQAYAGSAIFMHVGGSKPTSGCIALEERELLRIMRWLDPSKATRIVMGPEPWLLNPTPPPTVSATSPVGLTTANQRRVLDTRIGVGAPAQKLGPGQSIDVDVRAPGMPADLSVVALNVTITSPSLATYLKVTPTDGNSDVSNLNAHAGDERAALVMARVGPDGKVRITNEFGTAHVVADVVGYGAASVTNGFVPSVPNRIIDTRDATKKDLSSMLGPSEERTYATNAPAGTVAAIVNLTVTEATERTWVSAFAGGTQWPGTSSINVSPREDTANLAIVPLGTDKSMTFKNGLGNVNVIVDVFGWIRQNEGSRYVPAVAPTRVLDTRSGVGRRGQLGPDTSLTFAVTGMPNSATALVATVTGTNASAPTNLRVGRSDTVEPPRTSNLNLPVADPRANLVVSPVGTDGRALIYNQSGATDVLVDVSGWFV